MEIIEYDRSLPWVGDIHCPSCEGLTPAWISSEMSSCFPHFFCDSCSNVIHRESDQAIVLDEKSKELLEQIAATLPDCVCGGKFAPNCGPVCSHCKEQVPLVTDAVDYLHNSIMVVVDGACSFSDQREPFQVKIVGEKP